MGKVVRKLTRSEVKKLAIIDAATESFLEKGYGESSMDDIAQRAGVSKRTVYNHFPGKDVLFGAIIQGECERALETAHARMHCCEEDIPGTMRNFATDFLTMIYSTKGVKLFRTIVAEAERFPELGNIFFLAGVCPAQVKVQEYLEKMMEEGKIVKFDPIKAASQFFSLIKGEMHYKLLLCYQKEASREDIAELVDEGLEVWMRAYTPA